MELDLSDRSEESVTAWARLVRASTRALSSVEVDLKASGFPPLSWYDVLLELKRASPDRLRPFQLQERLLLAQYNLSRLIDRLEKAGYVAREDCADDGRGQVLAITEEGRALLRRMWPVYRRAIGVHFADKLSVDETATLARALSKLC